MAQAERRILQELSSQMQAQVQEERANAQAALERADTIHRELSTRLEAADGAAREGHEKLAVLESEHRHLTDKYEQGLGLIKALQGESRSLEARLLVLREEGSPYALSQLSQKPSPRSPMQPMLQPDFIRDAGEYLRTSPSREQRALGEVVLETAMRYPSLESK